MDVLQDVEKYGYMSRLFNGTNLFDRLGKQIPILAMVEELMPNRYIINDLINELTALGMDNETAKEYSRSFINLNRVIIYEYYWHSTKQADA